MMGGDEIGLTLALKSGGGQTRLELPHIQRLYERYAADPEVAILTINSQDEAGKVREFVARRSYTLPVLLDDGYAERAGVASYSTTWFVGKDGRIAFQLLGDLPENDLEEGWAWRIEALKEGS